MTDMQKQSETAEEKMRRITRMMTDSVRETAVCWSGTTGEVFRDLILENLAAIEKQIPETVTENRGTGTGRLEQNVIR